MTAFHQSLALSKILEKRNSMSSFCLSFAVLVATHAVVVVVVVRAGADLRCVWACVRARVPRARHEGVGGGWMREDGDSRDQEVVE